MLKKTRKTRIQKNIFYFYNDLSINNYNLYNIILIHNINAQKC